jgi:hypothetical protein
MQQREKDGVAYGVGDSCSEEGCVAWGKFSKPRFARLEGLRFKH